MEKFASHRDYFVQVHAVSIKKALGKNKFPPPTCPQLMEGKLSIREKHLLGLSLATWVRDSSYEDLGLCLGGPTPAASKE
jgi:hypothetical protein